MKVFVEYTNRKGKRIFASDHGDPRVFPNREAAKQFIRNHPTAMPHAEVVSSEDDDDFATEDTK